MPGTRWRRFFSLAPRLLYHRSSRAVAQNALRYFLFLLIAVGQATPPRDRGTSELQVPDSASISGRITEQGSGQPIGRAVVTLLPADRSRRVETTADSDGKYEFTQLRPGDYLLTAGPPELRSTHLNQHFGDIRPSEVIFPRSNLTLAKGEARTGLDIALFRALAIEGRVTSPWDEPMANMEVRLTRANGAPVPAESAHTDDRGTFRLFGLPPGRYRVCVEPHEMATEEAPRNALRAMRTCHPSATSEADAGEVVLTTADATGIDVRVQSGGTYSISGVVTRAEGTRAEGAFVMARLKDRPFGSSNSHARTASGEFVLRGLLPGRYLLTASAGHADSPERDSPERLEMALMEVDVSGDLANLHIGLSNARTVPGAVVFEGGTSPARLPHMVIHTSPPRGMSFMSSGPGPSSPVGDDLKFQLAGIHRMPLVVGVRGLPEGWIVRAVRFAGRDITSIASDLADPSTPGRLEIVLTKRIARGVVRVTNERGDPVTSCRVVILPADPRRWDGAPWWNEKTPAADGTVELLPQVPGDYLVAAVEASDLTLAAQPSGLDRIGKAGTKITLDEGDNPVFELRLARIAPIDR